MDTWPTDRVHFEMSPEGTWARAGERFTYTGPCDMVMEMETSERGTIRCQRYGTRIVSVTFPPGGLSPAFHVEHEPVVDSTPPISPAARPPSPARRPSAVRDWPEGFPARERAAAAIDLEDEEDPEEPEDEEAPEAEAAEGAEAEVPALMEDAEDGLWLEAEEDDDDMLEDEAPYPWLQDAEDWVLPDPPIGWNLDMVEEPLPEYHVGSPGTDLSGDSEVIQESTTESVWDSTSGSGIW